jgi:hypothetical protein
MIVLVPPRQRPPRAAGSYGPVSVLLHPSRLFGQPPPAASQADLAAVRAGQARRVVCWIRGSHPPFRPWLRQGWLDLSKSGAQWTPLWGIRRPALQITGPIESVWTRPADDREPGVKKGGQMYGAVQIPTCVVVTCQTPSGSIDLVVPQSDVTLVVGYFRPAEQPAP